MNITRSAKRAVCAATITLGTLGAFAGTSGQASAAAAPVAAHSRLWWDGRTCSLFAAFERKSTPRRFMQVVRAGERADTYLRVDVGLWYEDVRHGRPAAVIRADRSYVWADCNYTGDQGS